MDMHKDKLEKNRGLLMQISIIASLLIVLLLFENKTRSAEVQPKTFTEIELDVETQSGTNDIKPPNPGEENKNKAEVQRDIKTIASFPGGEKELRKYIIENMQYSEEAKMKDIQGRVIVKFKVNETGKVKDPEVIRSIHPILDTEAIRLVKNMPDWNSQLINGNPVSTIQTLEIIFMI